LLLIDALYINNSGGRTLLNYLVASLMPYYTKTFFLIDSRCKPDFDFLPKKNILYLEATLNNRRKFYKENSKKFNKILCFANLGPPTKIPQVEVITYFHNVLYLEPSKWFGKEQIIRALKKQLFEKYLTNTNRVWVQTTNVQSEFLSKYPEVKIDLMPFFDIDIPNRPTNKNRQVFLYVSTGAPHKNHDRLFKAWAIVNKIHSDWELHVTLGNAKIFFVMNSLKLALQNGAKIINHGVLEKNEMYQLYKTAQTIVYPSLKESFGLSLIEGAMCGCNIIAADLPYVHAVIEPNLVFNPYSVSDIAQKIVDLGENFTFKTPTIKVKNDINQLIAQLFTSN
jgi:glycosyltransferase involved in cell wall biosynthesis